MSVIVGIYIVPKTAAETIIDWEKEFQMSFKFVFLFADVETDTPPSKKHKKHKKHKHKKSKHHEEDEVVDVGGIAIPADQEMPKPAIKLRLKIGGHTLTKRYLALAGQYVQ